MDFDFKTVVFLVVAAAIGYGVYTGAFDGFFDNFDGIFNASGKAVEDMEAEQ